MRGALFLTALLCIILVSCRHSKNKYTVVVDNVDGLEEESDVRCAGLTVGKVTALDLFKDSVAVGIELEKSFKIPAGSKLIVEKGIWGKSHMVIERSKNPAFVKNYDTLSGYMDTSRFKIMAADTTKHKKMKESIQKIADGVKGLIEASEKDSLQNK